MDLRRFASPQLIISSRSVKQRTCAFNEIEFLDRRHQEHFDKVLGGLGSLTRRSIPPARTKSCLLSFAHVVLRGRAVLDRKSSRRGTRTLDLWTTCKREELSSW